MKTTEQLQALGLTKNEISLYLATLQIGPAPISRLASKAGVKRPTAYNHLDDLINKGLVHQVVKGKRKLYATHPPEQLLEVLEQQRHQVAQALPYLNSLYHTTPKQPRVMFYEGKAALVRAYREIWSTPQTIYTAFSPERYFQVFTPEDNEEFYKLLMQNGGQINDLVERSAKAEEFMKHSYRKGSGQAKFLPESTKLAVDFLATTKVVALVSLRNQTATVIDDPDIAAAHVALFKTIWNSI